MNIVLRTTENEHIEFKTNTISIVEGVLKAEYVNGNDNSKSYLIGKKPVQFVIKEKKISQMLIQS